MLLSFMCLIILHLLFNTFYTGIIGFVDRLYTLAGMGGQPLNKLCFCYPQKLWIRLWMNAVF